MTSLTELLQPGQGCSWLHVPSAMLLGVRHASRYFRGMEGLGAPLSG